MTQNNYDFERYVYGALAARLASSEESSQFAPGALEMLAGEKGLNLGEDAEGFVQGTLSSEDGTKIAIGTYANKFSDARSSYKPIDLVDWYGFLEDDLDNEEREILYGVLNQTDETLGSINKKAQEANHKLEGPEGMYSKAELAEARQTLERYQKALTVIGTLDNYMFEGLRPEVIENVRKDNLKGLVSKL